MKTCEELMCTNLEWLTENDTIQRAAELMAEAGVGFLPICDVNKRAIGVVTDRDLTTRVLAKGVSSRTTSATLVMTTPAITCREDSSLQMAEDLMAKERKSRLVITDAEGRLTGILSIADLIEHAPSREALHTVRAVLWREALGPRAGASRGVTLLKDDPIAKSQPPTEDSGDQAPKPTVMTGAHRAVGMKEFPG
jgi:signal-transduction protein with cAMP-binding, CBS, and nucleotidyltransferase domain